MNEPRQLLRDTLRALAEQPIAELVTLIDRPRREEVRGASGRAYRVKSSAFWDAEAWGSDLFVEARVFELSGWRRRFPHKSGLTIDPDSGAVFPHHPFRTDG